MCTKQNKEATSNEQIKKRRNEISSVTQLKSEHVGKAAQLPESIGTIHKKEQHIHILCNKSQQVPLWWLVGYKYPFSHCYQNKATVSRSCPQVNR